MDASSNSGSSSSSSRGSSSMSAPPQRRPKSPPGGGFDLYGKRRQSVKVQILEREIGLLQEELKSTDDLQAASKCCKELDDFVGAKLDPLVPINQKIHKSNLCWKKLCFPWICCSSGCGPNCKVPDCCGCCRICKSHWQLCSCMEKMACKKCWRCSCRVPCSGISCCSFDWSLSSCAKMNLCRNCSKACDKSCCL